jgi:hypothetical protein
LTNNDLACVAATIARVSASRRLPSFIPPRATLYPSARDSLPLAPSLLTPRLPIVCFTTSFSLPRPRRRFAP